MQKGPFSQLQSWLDEQAVNYQVDSNYCSTGSVFFALPGAKTDGHRFLEQVAQKGAIAAVVSKSYTEKDYGLRLFFVEDVLKTLQDLAKERLQKMRPKIIGITGSVGKTTTKEFTATLLEANFRLAKSFANYNGQIGLPLSVLNAEKSQELFVLEMAMTHPGQIARLVEIAPPEIAVITKIDWVHSENFATGIEGICQAKAEILQSSATKVRIIPYEWKNLTTAPVVTFSLTHREADYFLKRIDDKYYLDERGVRAICLEMPFHEEQFLEDALAAIAIARESKLSYERISKRISLLQPPKMRFEKIPYKGSLLINDAYNAGPESIRLAIQSLPLASQGRKRIGVFGEMSHLGKFSQEVHRKIGQLAVEAMDEVLCIGSLCQPICDVFQEAKKPATLYKSLSGLTKKLKELMMPGDVILIKGSRHLSLEQILQKLD